MSDKKVAVVTGSGRGIGMAIAVQLAGQGYDIVVADVCSPEDAAEAIAEIQKAGSKGFFCKCDISDSRSRQELRDFTREKFGCCNLLVNNAGVAPITRMDILETTQESVERLLRINLEGTFFMSQLFANWMIEQKNAKPDGEFRIVNISSMSAYTSSTSRGEYCISKAGISMVTKLFADRLAEFGIGVFEIRPGIIETKMTSGVKEKYDKLIAEGITPIKRWGKPQDIAKAIGAIAAGNLDFSTGQVINVDGGFHLRRL
ncbi:MAG TPA: 3-ketoacyl-ACP reductase [Phycisphaerae bacterium]|nr:3-ketoacyl-ACP reductase [Phycisphaerae bacterium]